MISYVSLPKSGAPTWLPSPPLAPSPLLSQGSQCYHDKLRFRFPSSLEVNRAKHFSNCTLPVIFFAHWIQGFGGERGLGVSGGGADTMASVAAKERRQRGRGGAAGRGSAMDKAGRQGRRHGRREGIQGTALTVWPLIFPAMTYPCAPPPPPMHVHRVLHPGGMAVRSRGRG